MKIRLFPSSHSASALALAIAISTVSALSLIALETPASARDDDDEKEEVKPEYSDAFKVAYKPIKEQVDSGAPDYAVLIAAIPALEASVTTDWDRQAAGSMIYRIGSDADKAPLQLRGVEMMLASGKVAPASQAQFNFIAGQLAYQLKDFAKSRSHILKAIDLGWTKHDPEALVFESYFNENKIAEGVDYLNSVIAAKAAAGQPVPESWIKRGLAMAYNNDLAPQARELSTWYVKLYPSDVSWGDAVAITLNTGKYQSPEILDLMRLAGRANTLRDENMFLEYIEAADYRRLPAEVIAVINQGYASGLLPRDNQFVADTLKRATGRAAADKADLAGIASDARAANAGLPAVLAAADIFLSVGKAADAEEFYTKALTMPGVDTAEVLTRLGIAQFDQGKYAEAGISFDKVKGPREAIADFWSIYVEQRAEAGQTPPVQTPAPVPAPTPAPTTEPAE